MIGEHDLEYFKYKIKKGEKIKKEFNNKLQSSLREKILKD